MKDNNLTTYSLQLMTNTMKTMSKEPFEAPVCSVLLFYAEAAICETSFTGGDLEPGTGTDWTVL